MPIALEPTQNEINEAILKGSNLATVYVAEANSTNRVQLISRACRVTGIHLYSTQANSRSFRIYNLGRLPETSDIAFFRFRTGGSAGSHNNLPDGGIWCPDGVAIKVTTSLNDYSDDVTLAATEFYITIYWKPI